MTPRQQGIAEGLRMAAEICDLKIYREGSWFAKQIRQRVALLRMDYDSHHPEKVCKNRD